MTEVLTEILRWLDTDAGDFIGSDHLAVIVPALLKREAERPARI